MRFRSYAVALLALTLAFVLVSAAVSVVIDPYGLFGLVRIDGVNSKKVYAYTHKHLAKQMRALRLRPQTVVLGNSRVDVGFNPASDRWPDAMRPVDNMGIPGDGMERLAESYDFTTRQVMPKAVFIGLDFFDFLFATPPQAEFRLPIRSSSSGDMLRKLPETVLSTTAFLDSIKTVLAQYDPSSEAMTDAGFNPMRNYAAIVRREGQWPMVDSKDRQTARYLVERSRSVYLPNGDPTGTLVYLRDILTDAANRGQRVVLFTYPMHAHFYALFAVSGRWALFEEWKRAIVAEWESVRADNPDWPMAFWDFALLNPITTEPAPLPDHRDQRMHWYWEPGHFKAALGEILIGQMAGTVDGFGVPFQADRMDEHLAQQRIALDAYLDSHPDDVAYLRGLCQSLGCAPAD